MRWMFSSAGGGGALRGAFLPESVNAGRNVRTEGFRVVVQGEAGKRYDIEATETPAIPSSWVGWRPIWTGRVWWSSPTCWRRTGRLGSIG